MESVAEIYQGDSRISFIQNLDDIGQPFSCEGWAQNCGTESYDIVNDGNEGHFLFDLFSLDDYWHNITIIDHNMVFRSFMSLCYSSDSCPYPSTSNLQEIIEEILSEMSVPGDLNNDGVIDVIDIISMIDIILNDEYNPQADILFNGVVDILDVIQIVNIILASSNQ